jgi:erythromycin esterase
VIFERGVAEMDPYDRYVTGATDALPMGEELYPWRTEEVRDLFVWLRDWNTGRADGLQVRVAGMDMQGPRGLPLALRLLDDAGMAAPANWRRLAHEVGERRNDVGWLEAARATWQSTALPPFDQRDPPGRWLALLARTFEQWLEFWLLLRRSDGGQAGEAFVLRDRSMAENTLAQLERFGPETQGVIWAYNLHVYCSPEPPVVGAHLRARLGAAYRTVCFAFGRGSFNAGSQRYNTATRQPEGPIDWTLRPHAGASPPPGSTEYLLDQLGLDCFAVAPAEVEALRYAPLIRTAGTYGWEGAEAFPDRRVPADVYDILVYFREVHPSRLLP